MEHRAATPHAHFYATGDVVFQVRLHEPEEHRGLPEAFVQDLWRARRFDTSALYTTGNASVEILDPGTVNRDQGPDFSGARLRIDGTEWYGDVEIHTSSGTWFDHRHHLDARYNSVILHVALYADMWTGGLRREDGTVVPELILHPYLERPVRSLLYAFHTAPRGELLCASAWHRIPEDVRRAWVETLARERLEAKKDRLAALYLQSPQLEDLLHERLFAALGYAKNTEAMATLARRIPLSVARSIEEEKDLEALHLGVAGLLPEPGDLLKSDRASADYVMDLRDRFHRIRIRFDPPLMPRTMWRFFRLRPANFPPLRVAQAVALLKAGGLLHRDPVGTLIRALRSEKPLHHLRRSFRVAPGSFWRTHVRLEKATRSRDPRIRQSRVDALLINAVVPVLMLVADQEEDPGLASAVIQLLRDLPAEQDEITRRFARLGSRPVNALESQGLHQLYRTRCVRVRCLSCAVGTRLLDRR